MELRHGDLIAAKYEANLRDARDALLPDGVAAEPSDAELRRLRLAGQQAAKMTRREVGADVWRRWRQAQTQLGAPQFRPSADLPGRTERIRVAGSGSLRIDLVEPTPRPPT